MIPKEDNAKGDDDLRVRESRCIRKDGEGHISHAREAAHTPYSSKYFRMDFTLWQHIALIAIMQRMRK